jgi:hypothetical protein
MDLYKNVALDVNKFLIFISTKENSELIPLPQNDQRSQTT